MSYVVTATSKELGLDSTSWRRRLRSPERAGIHTCYIYTHRDKASEGRYKQHLVRQHPLAQALAHLIEASEQKITVG